MAEELPQNSELLLYEGEDGELHIDVRLYEESVWLTQAQICTLFDKSKATISEHIKNIFEEGELDPAATVRKFRTVQTEGGREVTRLLEFYNLDVIITVGYRVKSPRGTRFRQWATGHLREFIVKGFTMDDRRLAEGRTATDYFDELIERVRAIRTSERNFWRKITDIYATSVDYDADADVSHTFFATVQNKMHFAIHGHTAAELVDQRVDASKPNMGLTTYSGDHIRKKDVSVAKNFLSEDELKDLNLIVDQYLSFAEAQARRHIPMHMSNWVDKLNGFLTLNDREILDNAGSISHSRAKKKAESEYGQFQVLEDRSKESDFDQFEKSVEVFLPGKKDKD